ncbi:MAG: site-specific DNA-methyltransferase [Bacteroidetes bacterium]|nr:site-specific DNA-methyltransferase [Bacteroidota bacterium]
MPTLHFKGKTFVQHHHLAVKYHQLKARPDLSITDRHSLHDNLIVRGDNLLALKALLPTLAGQVKCIYIDPPYNTGNEGWVYNDNVNSPMIKSWLGQVVDKEDLTRHDKWLCMMMPRLKLLHEMLREDGAIFISIDDNEQHNLRCLMDEVFGEQNFVTNIIWQKNYAPKSSAKFFSEDHDFIICYAKNIDEWVPNLLARTEEQDKIYKNLDNDPRGRWRPNNLAARNYYSKGTYSIKCPGGRIIDGPPKGSYWRLSEEKFWQLDKDGRIWWGENGNNIPAPKIFLTEVMQGRVPQTLWHYKDVGHTQDAKKELLSILDFDNSEDVFITPKPSSLIKRILEIATDEDSIILDSYAGSGTTAQAVLDLNNEDGGNRRFVLVECEDYAETLTRERVKRVIEGIPTAKNEKLKEGLGGSFSYFELGEEVDEGRLLTKTSMPSYEELARHLFFTAEGEQLDPAGVVKEKHYVGESSRRSVWLWYEPDVEVLRRTGFTMADALALPKPPAGKRHLVFAPMKFMDDESLQEIKIDFLQLPYEIYRIGE